MPDSSTIKSINKTTFNTNAGAAIRGKEINQIGNLLNNISAQNGINVFVSTSGIRMYSTQKSGVNFRFKMVASIDDEDLPQLKVYNGSWIRNDIRVSLVGEGIIPQYVIVPNAVLSGGRNYIYVEIDNATSPNIIEVKATTSMAGYEPSTKEPDGNIICFIGYVDMFYTTDVPPTPYLANLTQWVFQDIIKDNISQIEESTGVYTDGGSSGVEFEIVTNVQWDETLKELQKKIRTVEIVNGRFIVSEESDWVAFATAEPCPT